MSQIDAEEIPDEVIDNWTELQEMNFLLVLEAHRRYLGLTKNEQAARTLTLAWSMLESRMG